MPLFSCKAEGSEVVRNYGSIKKFSLFCTTYCRNLPNDLFYSTKTTNMSSPVPPSAVAATANLPQPGDTFQPTVRVMRL